MLLYLEEVLQREFIEKSGYKKNKKRRNNRTVEEKERAKVLKVDKIVKEESRKVQGSTREK